MAGQRQIALALAGLCLAIFALPTQAQEATPRRLTNDPAHDGNPSWSPDGKRIAFESNRDGNFEIYVVDVDGGNLIQITDRPGANVSPTWAPDGASILYFSFQDGRAVMRVIASDGTNDRAIGDGFRPVSSLDGSRIAADVYLEDLETHQIHVMDADGRNRVRLTQTRAYEAGPQWSPDGKRLVFFSLRDSYPYDELRDTPSEIYVMNSDGTEPVRLTHLRARSKYPRWAPDGDRIAFESDFDGNEEIYAIRTDGSGLTNLTRHPGRDRNAGWSPDGNKMVFASDRDGNFELYIAEVPPGAAVEP